MIREDRFIHSRSPYAVDLGSLTLEERKGHSGPYWHGRITAVWFRGTRSATKACVGYLWDSQHVKPTTGAEFLLGHEDGRHGGDCEGRWDGRQYWGGKGEPETIERHLELLRPMLANYPQIPPGFDGWWRF